jgi:hypothetical protein
MARWVGQSDGRMDIRCKRRIVLSALPLVKPRIPHPLATGCCWWRGGRLRPTLVPCYYMNSTTPNNTAVPATDNKIAASLLVYDFSSTSGTVYSRNAIRQSLWTVHGRFLRHDWATVCRGRQTCRRKAPLLRSILPVRTILLARITQPTVGLRQNLWWSACSNLCKIGAPCGVFHVQRYLSYIHHQGKRLYQ